MRTKEDGKDHEVKVQFLWYGTTNKRDKSGAYLFLPDGKAQVSSADDMLMSGINTYGQSLEEKSKCVSLVLSAHVLGWINFWLQCVVES
jgi:hypothetical protein